ncbi:MAG: DUF1844 domain-containing protein [Acidobacteriota bacterium]|nr:MAG: DUF1844 domain-containing protein [Acidobacteriota bacterium]
MEEHGEGFSHDAGIKVVDRRKFNSDGSFRRNDGAKAPGGEAEAERPSSEASQPEPSKKDSAPESSPEEQAVDSTSEPSSKEQAADSVRPTPLLSLILSLATSAQIALGDVESPSGGDRYVNIEEAHGYIDMLEDLQRKTEGRLTPDEDRILRSVLYELHMRYVARQQEILAPRT